MTSPFPFQSGSVLQAQQLNDITNLPINDQTASYTLVVGDAGKRVVMDVATANTVTVDDSVFTTGDTIFIANKGAGASTLTAGAGVTINSASGLDLVTSQSGQLVALSASSFLFVASFVTVTSGVVQVKSATKTDTFTTASTTYVDVTGLTVSITPTSASNKVFVSVSTTGAGTSGTNIVYLQLVRDSTAIALGDTAGSRSVATSGFAAESSNFQSNSPMSFLDSPATTVATTYKVQMRVHAGTGFLNRSQTDTNGTNFGRYSSTITVMEVTP